MSARLRRRAVVIAVPFVIASVHARGINRTALERTDPDAGGGPKKTSEHP